MSNITVQKMSGQGKETLPVSAEIGDRLEEVRRRAHDVFQLRTNGAGLELDDWLTAERQLFGWAKAELAEKDNAYQIQVALPGFDAKDVQVTVATGEIVVHATAQHHQSEASPIVLWSEFDSSDLYRRFELPKPVALDKVSANLEQGILRITAPCTSQAKPATSQKQTKVVAA